MEHQTHPPTLHQAYLNKGSTYQPRTQHLNQDGSPKYINELILQSSPYLLQHAHNPVFWHGWSEKTLAKAKKENKLIFLSIGYATCHWCHVMEEESFDDQQVGQVLNKDFISIKVDREIRPDVDEVFMAAVQLLNKHGGWPLNVILTPDAKAFFGGTYFPKAQLLSLLGEITTLWQSEKATLVLDQAELIEKHLNAMQQQKQSGTKLKSQAIQRALSDILASFDELEGGFGQAPKFPQESRLLFLLNQQQYQASQKVLEVITATLDAMAQGGFYDVVGGGFARYSTDNSWLVPHFEKMLYNQAQLSLIYAKTYEITQDPWYRRIAEQTLDYVLKEMQDKNGGFYSATDADSEGEEGTFFVWDLVQIQQVLGKDLFEHAQKIFDFSEQTLFEGRHIIRYQQKLTPDDYALADSIIAQLYQARNKRPKPLLDDKILLSWNALMAFSYLKVGQIFKRQDYIQVAQDSFNFLLKFKKADGLKRVLLAQHYQADSLLEDYVYWVQLALGLYDNSRDDKYLKQAELLSAQAIADFWDKENFGFFNHQTKQLYIKPKTAEDGAILSANAVMFDQLIKLSKRSEYLDYGKYAQQLLQAFSTQISGHEAYFASMMVGLNQLFSGSREKQQWAYQGQVYAQLMHISGNNGQINYQLQINLADNYHINGSKPLQKDLVPTQVRVANPKNWQLSAVNYPKPTLQTFKFSKDKLAIYDDQVVMDFFAKRLGNNGQLPKILLDIQACNDVLCFPPEQLLFN